MGAVKSESYLDICKEAFIDISNDFGFDDVNDEQLGREYSIYFHKGPRTISITFEGHTLPIVELYYPASDTGETPTAWAARKGVPYCRKIPALVSRDGYNGDRFENLRKFITLRQRRLLSMSESSWRESE